MNEKELLDCLYKISRFTREDFSTIKWLKRQLEEDVTRYLKVIEHNRKNIKVAENTIKLLEEIEKGGE